MDQLVELVGRLLSALHGSYPLRVCPGDWAWTTTMVGGLVALLPMSGAIAAAMTRRFTGNRYGAGPLLLFGLLGGLFTALLPWLLFYSASEVFRGAAQGRLLGLSGADVGSLGVDYCFAPPQAAYLGEARTVREVVASLSDSRPAVFVGGLALLAVLPLLCLLFVFGQSRLAFRRGPKWPARLLWVPMLLPVLGTAGLPATTVAHLWLGFLPVAVLGTVGVLLAGAPRWSVIDKPGAVGPGSGPGPAAGMVPPPGVPRGTPPRGAPAQVLPRRTPPHNRPPPGTPPYGTPPQGSLPQGPLPAGSPYGTPAHGLPMQGGPLPSGLPRRRSSPMGPLPVRSPHGAGPGAPGLGPPGPEPPERRMRPGPQPMSLPQPPQPPRRPTAPLSSPPLSPSPLSSPPLSPPAAGQGEPAPQQPERALAADPGPLPETLRRALGLAAAGPTTPVDPPEPPTLPPSRFRRIRPLGSGGFGTVWLAMDTALDRTVAVKVAKVPDAETERRIRREARALAAVHHPNCVRIYDILTDADGELAIVMEYVPGRSLSGEIDSRGRLSDASAARLWGTLAGVLHAAHGQGVLHRDVKPSNIIIDDGGYPHLIDFGIARAVGDVTLTAAGMVLGTPDFMAPEVAAGKVASPSSDAWQLAATVSYALAGRPPRGHRDGAIAAMLAAAQGEPCNQIPPQSAHRALLEQALHPDPAQRPSLPAIQAELGRWLATIGQHPDGPVTERLAMPTHPEPAWPTDDPE